MGTNRRRQSEGDRKATRKLGRSRTQQGKARTAKLLGKKRKAAKHTKKAIKLRKKADAPRLKKKTQVSKGTLKERVVAGSRKGLGETIGKIRDKRKRNKKSVTRFKKK